MPTHASTWYWVVLLIVLALAEHWIDEYLELLEDEREHELHLSAIQDCAKEGGDLIEQSDLETARESAEEHGLTLSVLFTRGQFVCIQTSIPEPEEDEDG